MESERERVMDIERRKEGGRDSGRVEGRERVREREIEEGKERVR